MGSGVEMTVGGEAALQAVAVSIKVRMITSPESLNSPVVAIRTFGVVRLISEAIKSLP